MSKRKYFDTADSRRLVKHERNNWILSVPVSKKQKQKHFGSDMCQWVPKPEWRVSWCVTVRRRVLSFDGYGITKRIIPRKNYTNARCFSYENSNKTQNVNYFFFSNGCRQCSENVGGRNTNVCCAFQVFLKPINKITVTNLIGFGLLKSMRFETSRLIIRSPGGR